MRSDTLIINDVITGIDTCIDTVIDIKYEIEKIKLKDLHKNSNHIQDINTLTTSLNRQINFINSRVNDILFCLQESISNTKNIPHYEEYTLVQLSDYLYKLVLPPLLKKTHSLYSAPQLRYKRVIKEITEETFVIANIKQFKKADIVFHSVISDSKYYIDADHLQVHHILNSLVPFFISDDSPEYVNVHYQTTVIPTISNNYTVVFIIGDNNNTRENFINFLQSDHYKKV